MPDIICLGEPIVDMVATEACPDLVNALHFTKAAGGAPLNVAAAAACLGASSGIICKAGGDHFGDFIRVTLEELGVDVEYFLQDPHYATQLSFIAKDEAGVPDFAFHVKRSADQRLELDDLDLGYIVQGEVFHFGTITLIHEPVRTATREALRTAREAGLLISLDPNWRPALWESADDALRMFLVTVPECDVLKVSGEELIFLTGENQSLEQAAEIAADMGPELVLVTLGEQGAYFYSNGEAEMVPGYQSPVVDTVGCGDAFVAAMLTQLVESPSDVADLSGDELYQMVKFANAAAALTATGPGVMGSLPRREQVQELLDAGTYTEDS